MSDNKQEMKVDGWVGNPADLTSFNAFGVVTLSDLQTVNVQITGRHGISAEKLYEDFTKFIAFLDRCATDSAVKFWDGKKGSQNTPENTVHSTGEKKTERKYDQPIPQSELPAELAEITVDVFEQDFDEIIVKPELDDKATVEFHKDGLEFPVGARINKWKHDTVVKSLAGVVENLDPSKPGKFRIAGVQYWKTGSEYTNKKTGKTGNWKDLLLVKAAF